MTKVKGVYKRRDGRYEARYVKGISESGKTIYGAVYGKTSEEVIEKRKAIIGDDESSKQSQGLKLLILGAGSHGRDIKEIADSFRVFKEIKFLDDEATGEDIIGTCKEAINFKDEFACAFVAIGDNKKRSRYVKLLQSINYIQPSIISPSATISTKARIGDGVAILPQSTVGDAEIGDYCILASNSLVNSGAVVGAYSHVDCGAIVLKNSRLPERTWVKCGKIYR